ncbi:MAG: hypothetical protein KDA63_16525, partial [Planctomycetales bacterium]|nr:hypothetical protein [Planctomycetales bacterium]
SFFRDDDDGHLLGGSKPIFAPNAGEVASAESDGLPDGTIHDVLEILCQVSRTYDIDWEISHDYFEGAIGLIQGGQADAEVVQQLAALGELGDIVTEFGLPDAPGEPSDVDDDEPGLRLFQGDA